MSLRSKISKIGFPKPNLPDKESKSIHRDLINKSSTNKNILNVKTTSNQKLYKRNENSRNFIWDSISATHLLKRTITGCSF